VRHLPEALRGGFITLGPRWEGVLNGPACVCVWWCR
jgi:hypothetical protein